MGREDDFYGRHVGMEKAAGGKTGTGRCDPGAEPSARKSLLRGDPKRAQNAGGGFAPSGEYRGKKIGENGDQTCHFAGGLLGSGAAGKTAAAACIHTAAAEDPGCGLGQMELE